MLNKLFGKKTKEIPGNADSHGRIISAPTTRATDTANHVVGVDNNRPANDQVPPVIAVLGAKGGVGASSIAVNLAAALAISGVKTTLVDANLQQPDAAQLMGIEPEHSLMEMLKRMPILDWQLYEACCTPVHGCGANLNLLSPPIDGEAALKTNLSQLAECLKLIRCYAGGWVIDLPRHLDKHLITLTDLCDKILLVFEPTVTGVAACRRWLNIFRDLGYDRQRLICVLNRAGSKYTAVEQQLGDCFADEQIFRLPNASAAAWDCSTAGVPIMIAQPQHAYARAMLKLAQDIVVSAVEGFSGKPEWHHSDAIAAAVVSSDVVASAHAQLPSSAVGAGVSPPAFAESTGRGSMQSTPTATQVR